MSRHEPRREGRWLRRGVAALALGLAVLALAAWQRPRAAGVETAPVERRSLEETILATGRIRPYDFVDVGAQVSGQLARLHVAIGDHVAAGDLLAEIDAEVEAAEVEALRAERAGLEASLAEQLAELAYAEAVNHRNEAIGGRTLTQTVLDAGRRDVEMGRARADRIRAGIAQATATLAAREAALRRAAIRAPIAGTVVAIKAREGQTLNANYDTPVLMTIADLDRMTVWTEVSEADVARLHVGMPLWFATLGAPGDRRRATLRQILPMPPQNPGDAGKESMAFDSKVIVYLALFDAPNPDHALLSGMTAQVGFVQTEARDVLTIPVAALGPGGVVRVAGADGRLEPRRVETGLVTRFHAEVTGGLAEGERVVIGDAPEAEARIRLAP